MLEFSLNVAHVHFEEKRDVSVIKDFLFIKASLQNEIFILILFW